MGFARAVPVRVCLPFLSLLVPLPSVGVARRVMRMSFPSVCVAGRMPPIALILVFVPVVPRMTPAPIIGIATLPLPSAALNQILAHARMLPEILLKR